MVILITGANGFLGTNLGKYLEEKGDKVVRTDLANADITGDLTDQHFVLQELAGGDFETVVHLAGLINVPKSIEDPYACYRINDFGTLNMLKMAVDKKVKRFVYISSNNVYGSPKKLPITEDYPFNPRAPYDFSKVVGEYLVTSFHNTLGLPTTILRSWKLFGPHDVPTAAVPRFIKACLANTPIPLYNGGRDTNDVYYVENFCSAIALAINHPAANGERFNVGTGSEISVRELAMMIKKLTRSSSKVQLLPSRTPTEKTPMRTRPSIAKVKRVLGYKPIVGLREGLEKTIQWHREHHN
jgi:nucleoside-diphosphate-sugar epimerase